MPRRGLHRVGVNGDMRQKQGDERGETDAAPVVVSAGASARTFIAAFRTADFDEWDAGRVH
jgi:hypothetical protein